ncbi:ankyrin repeat domain-containing protein 40-like [Anthonomus grandis grandis]|uniref:ankyrin repeat domain-containing protein 40-like n=1 Tax=Anthonomus grandis grandis TaxID=2921223 RepID=UPI0021663ECD|nr:ankyrin repeat domain-containing protein 40-like [Anthonomus grandis grandis]
MANILEGKLLESSAVGDLEALETLLWQNMNVNCRKAVNGWTPLHWACKRGNEKIARLLLLYGADKTIRSIKGETAANVCPYSNIKELLGVLVDGGKIDQVGPRKTVNFVPNYIRNAPLNAKVELGSLKPDLLSMQKTALPTAQNDDLVLKVRINGSPDPDFIEIEIPRWKLTYSALLKICCEELEVSESQVDRIRKLPDTRLRKDNDIKRLVDFQALEIVLKSNNSDRSSNCYQSISSCKDQTVLY